MSPTKPRVLFVFTSHGTLISGAPTGYFLPEPARPYYVLAPHADIDFASPKGGTPPLDPPSFKTFYEDQKDESSIKFFHDEVVQNKLKNSIKLSEVDASKYDAVFFPGGDGPMFDLPDDPINAKLIEDMWESGKIVSSVCHGAAAFSSAKDRKTGEWIFKGKRISAFSNEEEKLKWGGEATEIPFLLENRMKELGGKYESTTPFGEICVVDGRLITGQNPQSSTVVGEALLKQLQN